MDRKRIRHQILRMSKAGELDPHNRPSRAYRVALRPTKPAFDWLKTKNRRRMQKHSRRINRTQ